MKFRWKKIARILLAFVLSLYVILSIGLSLVSYFIPKEGHPEDAVLAHSKEPHAIRVQDSGIQSFHERLKLIASAKNSIEVEFFIYNVDDAARLFTQALIKKAQEGVKVRILVDFSSPIFQLRPVYARYLKSHGIETRYYNTSKLYRLLSMQHRSHRKLLIVDGDAAVTGGRNIANEYFDIGKEYNFLDTDIEIRGPIVTEIRESFDLYWSSELSSEPEGMDQALDEDETKLAREKLEPQPGDHALLERVGQLGAERAAKVKTHSCPDVTFVTDFPNQGEANRRVFKAIVEEMEHAKEEIVAESPYFVIEKGGYEVLQQLSEKGVRLRFLTNSLYSTDASYAVGSPFFRARWLSKTGLELAAFKGGPVEGQSLGEFTTTNRWGVHSKRAVVDGSTVLIGTYNIDPRSANLNSELMFVCRGNTELAAEVLKRIDERRDRSILVIGKDRLARWSFLSGASVKQIVIFFLLLPISNLFSFLL